MFSIKKVVAVDIKMVGVHSSPVMCLYVLKLENEKYYVGISLHVCQRLGAHFNGHGSKFTQKYKPLEVVEIVPMFDCTSYEDAKIPENRKTFELMIKYGWKSVRGGDYCRIYLKKPMLFTNPVKFLIGKALKNIQFRLK